MTANLSISHPDTSNNPITYVNADYLSGTTLSVVNSSAYNVNDYIIVEQIGNPICEVTQITAIPSNTTLTIGALSFGHTSGTIVTQTSYNQVVVYRSTTGIGGSYSTLATVNVQYNQDQTFYEDVSALPAYSYQFAYYNSYNSNTGALSAELPFSGYPIYSLSSIQKMVLKLFGDKRKTLVSEDDIRDWLNLYIGTMMSKITGGENPFYITNYLFTTTGAESYDITAQSFINILKIEYSTDGGQTYMGTIYPSDFRWDNYGDGNNLPEYFYRLAGEQLFIQDNARNNIVAGNYIRVWGYTNPTLLSLPSDTLPNPFKPFVDHFIDYLLMRAYEARGKITDDATHFNNKINARETEIVTLVKHRIRQVGMATPSLYLNNLY